MDAVKKFVEQSAAHIVAELGQGYSESVYHRAFEHNLRLAGIHYESEVVVPVTYRGVQVGHGRADLVMCKGTPHATVLEFKSVVSVDSRHCRQLQGYMTNMGIANGAVVNFSDPVEIRWTE